MAVGDGIHCQPKRAARRCACALQRAMWRASRARRTAPSSPAIRSSAASTPQAMAGGVAVVKIYVRARCTSQSIASRCATTQAPAAPAALPNVPI